MLLEPLSRTVHRLGRLAVESRDLPDADLLRRFAETRDEAAFAALVRRHGPMVFGVCCRSLGQVQDAEDAFQATFLILARKATSVRAESVGRWLYGVAVKVANKARVRRDRRTFAAIDLNQLAAPVEPPPADWLPLLDTALAKLPDRERWPIVLCDLQGRSRTAVAAELGIAEGTLSSRLTRARLKLRARLVRLGIAPTLAALATGLTPESVPAHLLESTLAAEVSAVAARELAEGVLRSMILAKIAKLAAIGVFAVAIVGFGFSQVETTGADPKPAAKESSEDSPPAKDAPRVPARSDAERFKGTWIVESTLRDGGSDDKDMRGLWVGAQMTFDGEKVKFSRFPGKTKLYKLDPGWDLKHIDFEFRDVPDGNGWITKLVPSIYRFEGEKLHIVFGVLSLEDRPESFAEVKSGPPFTHIFLKRAEPKEPKDIDIVSLEEQKRLEGRWVMIAAEASGQRKEVSGTLLILKGSHFTLRPSAEGQPTEGEYAVDADAYPRQIDLKILVTRDPASKGKTLPGIYAVNRGELALCLDEVGKGRPKSLKADNSPVMYFVREGEEPKEPVLKPATGRIRELQQQRVKALEAQLVGQLERVKIGKDQLSTLIEVVRELAEAELDLADTHEKQMAAVERMLKSFVTFGEQIVELQAAGLQTKENVAQITAARLKAEIQLEKLKAGK